MVEEVAGLWSAGLVGAVSASWREATCRSWWRQCAWEGLEAEVYVVLEVCEAEVFVVLEVCEQLDGDSMVKRKKNN